MSTQLHLSDRNLPDYVRRVGLAGPADEVSVEPAGDGNINWVRRVRLAGGKSTILKQARPALEKFPEYEVSTERLVFEARYLERARPFDMDDLLPRVVWFDEAERVLVMEDLGACTRLDAALAEGQDVTRAMVQLAAFLGRVHRGTAGDPGLPAAFANGAMRRLHGDHIFALPYTEAFPAPPRTAEIGERVRKDAELREIAARSYDAYLRDEGPLVHADVQPGNILLGQTGPQLLDAEIAHAGDPAFDVGTLLAHLAMPELARGRAADAWPLLREVWQAYARAHGTERLAAAADAVRYAGLELTRRTIGAARVAFVEDDEAGVRVLETGLSWIRTPESAAAELEG